MGITTTFSDDQRLDPCHRSRVGGRNTRARTVAGLLGALMLVTVLSLLVMATASAADKQVIKIAYIDPLSGPFGPVGTLGAQGFQFMFNKRAENGELGDYKVKLVPFDDKVDPSTAQVAAQKAADEGIRYILQGNGSNVAFALINWVKKHNREHPDDKMMYLNYAAVDPGLSNDDCGFYHFNLDANVNMKMAGLVHYIKNQPDIKKVFLINMDYSFGHATANAAKVMLKKARPDIQIVGDVYTPIGRTKDYTPYIYKIKQSGAQAVITGNWGQDMTLLAKAAGQSNLKDVRFFTFYAGIPGTPQAIGDVGSGLVMQITPWVATLKNEEMTKLANEFKQKYDNDFYYGQAVYISGMFAKAINEAGSTDPTKVGLALEGMHYDSPMGDMYVRADNHAIVMPMYLSTLQKGVKPYLKGSDLQFQENARIEAVNMFLPTSCKMANRPEGTSPNVYYNNTGK